MIHKLHLSGVQCWGVILILALSACESVPEPSSLLVTVAPEDASVQILPLEQNVAPGMSMSLPAGSYNVVVSKLGYDSKSASVELVPGASRTVNIDLGKGKGRLTVEAGIPGTMIRINGEERAVALDGYELLEGEYSVSAEAIGYYPEEQEVVIVPGETVGLQFELERIPTAKSFSITSFNEQAEIFLNDERIGVGAVQIPSLPFGQYQIRVVRSLTSYVRHVANQLVSVSRDGPNGVALSSPMTERRFEDRWLPEVDALSLEEQRYISLRDPKPRSARIAIDGQDMEALVQDRQSLEFLHSSLNLGDQLIFEVSDGTQRFAWKRNQTISDEFIDALDARVPYALSSPWAKDEATKLIDTRYASIADGARAIHLSRVNAPLLDLDDVFLSESGVAEVQRSHADKEIVVISVGDSIEINGSPADCWDGYCFARFEPDNENIKIEWSGENPQWVTVVSKQTVGQSFSPPPVELLIGQKQDVFFPIDETVNRIVRLTLESSSETLSRMEIDQGIAPLEGNTLRRDELGPHDESGSFARIWLVHFSRDGNSTQRQYAVDYKVLSTRMNVESDEFLRRGRSQISDEIEANSEADQP